MPRVPDCLNRRYWAWDNLIRELSERQPLSSNAGAEGDPIVKLLCDFWNILKEDPQCNLPEQVQQYFACCESQPTEYYGRAFPPQHIQCYMSDAPGRDESGAERDRPDPEQQRSEASESVQGQAEAISSQVSSGPPGPSDGSQGPTGSPKDPSAGPQGPAGGPQGSSGAAKGPSGGEGGEDPGICATCTTGREEICGTCKNRGVHKPCRSPCHAPCQPDAGGAAPALSKVMKDLRAAASVDNSCKQKMQQLLEVERHLRDEIKRLEDREKQGIELMKKADEMWSDMEAAYKEKISQSIERQTDLIKQVQAIEKSSSKWKKNKKDLESQLDSIGKCQNEIILKISQKTNDLKSIKNEIDGFQKRIKASENETEAVKKLLSSKKADSDARMSTLAKAMKKVEDCHKKEKELKKVKEAEGEGFIKEARENLQKMCKLLLQKKLEEEDLLAEKNALIEEINLLKDSCDACREKCKKKQTSLGEESNRLDKEIQGFQLQCVQCNQCIDTSDVRKFCIDCPRCEHKRKCLMQGDTCNLDAAEECVCQAVKEKFLDNVFENMYTVLERQIRTDAGKAIADEIASCLRKSRNGKLNERTRRILQEFILCTVKKKLNLTIVGGAVKTRCELDDDTFKKLMLCLTSCKATPVPKTDKGTEVKKDPCRRWGGPSECNCPKGPNECICTRKAPPPPHDPKPCPEPAEEDPGEKIECPHKKDVPCGPECGAHLPNKVGADVSKYRPDPCSSTSCAFGNNMRAAQCVLGPEALEIADKPGRPCIPQYPDNVFLDITCKCGTKSSKPCTCAKDNRTITRLKMIQEVMGQYNEVAPIERVAIVDENKYQNVRKTGQTNKSSSRSNNYQINFSSTALSTNRPNNTYDCSATYALEDVWIKSFNERQRGFSSNKNIKCDSSSQETLPDNNKSVEVYTRISPKPTTDTTVQVVSKPIPKSLEVTYYNDSPNTAENERSKVEQVSELNTKCSPIIEWVPVSAILNRIQTKASAHVSSTSKGRSNKSIPDKSNTNSKKSVKAKKKRSKKIINAAKRGSEKVHLVNTRKNMLQNIFDSDTLPIEDQVRMISHFLK